MARIRIFSTGRHAHRMPVSYLALAPLLDGVVEHVARPAEADLYLFAHSLDVEDAPEAMVADWRVRRRPVVLLSEEPFWDTIWGRRPMCRRRSVETAFGALPLVQVNHQTSAVFAFDTIPYYLLTNHRFANTYTARFARNARLSPAEWRDSFAARSVEVSFMFERRPEPFHSVHWPEGALQGLCAWRTSLAEACTGDGVERLGQSWQGGPSRFELTNWYRDKMTRMDGRARLVGAIENTHQPQYITEKLFDAFANGGLPLYFAGPGHRLHDFGLPEAAWLNLHGMTPEAAAERVAGLRWTAEIFEAYALAQHRLAARFGDPEAWVGERDRLAQSLALELETILSEAPDS